MRLYTILSATPVCSMFEGKEKTRIERDFEGAAASLALISKRGTPFPGFFLPVKLSFLLSQVNF